ncbi:MAG: hypothetical protein SFU25_06715 [Candidatus Caenarcaniphilales bacterium]|nr:hypothetical protein [Candidatus Caenarcaniphilales bacterium]
MTGEEKNVSIYSIFPEKIYIMQVSRRNFLRCLGAFATTTIVLPKVAKAQARRLERTEIGVDHKSGEVFHNDQRTGLNLSIKTIDRFEGLPEYRYIRAQETYMVILAPKGLINKLQASGRVVLGGADCSRSGEPGKRDLTFREATKELINDLRLGDVSRNDVFLAMLYNRTNIPSSSRVADLHCYRFFESFNGNVSIN